jgi:hypothetical protein
MRCLHLVLNVMRWPRHEQPHQRHNASNNESRSDDVVAVISEDGVERRRNAALSSRAPQLEAV